MKLIFGLCVFLLCITNAVASDGMATNIDTIDPGEMEAEMLNISPADQDEMLNVSVVDSGLDEMLDARGVEPTPEEMYTPLSWDAGSELEPQ